MSQSTSLPSSSTASPDELQPPSHIAYYISSHGYGHATRAIQLCHAFLRAYPELRITVVSQASSHIYVPLLNSSDRVTLRPVKTDSAVLQPTPYLLDVDTTVANLLQLRDEQDELVSIESKWLKTHSVDLVIADAPYLPCLAASASKLLSILITNFSFAEVFSYFTSMVDVDTARRLEDAVAGVIQGYQHADVWLRLPGWLPNPGFLPAQLPSPSWIRDEQLRPTIEGDGAFLVPKQSITKPIFERRILDTALISRPPTSVSRAEVLDIVEIPKGFQLSKILLMLLPLPDPPPPIPPGWICIVAGSTPTMPMPDRYFLAPRDIHIPDAMKVSNCVMAKLGYGTVSEVLAADVPVVYIPRRQFIEEYGLRKLVETWPGYENRATRLEIDEFEKGAWWDRILDLESRGKEGSVCPGPVDDGSSIRQMVVEQFHLWKGL